MNGLSLDPQILQLLCTQLNLDPSAAAALQSSDYTRLLGDRLAADPALAGNPMLGMLMNGLSAASNEEEEEEEEGDQGEGEDRAEAQLLVDGEDDRNVSTRAIAALRELATILGACACWGQDATCPDCDGLGEPGYCPPRDPALLLRWVQPNLRRMGLRLVRFKDGSRQTTHNPHETNNNTTTTIRPEE